MSITSSVRKPRPIVTLNGSVLTGVIEVEVTNASHFVADNFRVVLSSRVNPPSYWSASRYDQVSIAAGFEDEAAFPLITGQVDDVEYNPAGRTITLSGRDLSANFIDSKTSEKFQNQTASEIAVTLATRHGLGSTVQMTDTTAGTYYEIDHAVLTQEQSEWDLLVFLATQEGFDVWVSGTTLYFQPSVVSTSTPYQIEWIEGDVPISNATRLQLGRSETIARDIIVHVKSFNQKGQESVLGEAKRYGAKSARSGKAQLYTFRRPNLGKDQAQKLAESLLADLTRHEMTMAASLPGDNILTTRTLINLSGTGTAWDQQYYVDSVTRRLSFSEGYRMDVRAKNHLTQSSFMNGMTNLMRREAERAMNTRATTLMGLVSAYDPSHYAAKVILQPDGTETGFLPIGSPWVGNGWGFTAGPNIGDMVDVHFQEFGKGAPYIEMRFYGNKAVPQGAPSGECWMIHQSGSFIKFYNDGTIGLSAATAINSTAPIWNHTGDMIVEGMIRATGDIIDNTATNANNMASFRHKYDEHVHDSPDGVTGPPLAPDIL